MIKVAVCGANGKMGQEVCNAVEADNSMKLAAKIDIKGNAYRSIEEAKKYAEFEVVVDFTQPASIYENAKYCLRNGIEQLGSCEMYHEKLVCKMTRLNF